MAEAARDWLATGWPNAVRADDEHITGADIRFDVSGVDVQGLWVSGDQAAFQARQHGTYRGGLAGAAPGPVETSLDICGVVRIAAGRVIEGRVIRDRMGLLKRVGKAS